MVSFSRVYPIPDRIGWRNRLASASAGIYQKQANFSHDFDRDTAQATFNSFEFPYGRCAGLSSKLI